MTTGDNDIEVELVSRKSVAERLRAARIAADLTQREFAEFLGVPIGSLSQWELGRILPPTKYLWKIKRRLNIPLEYLIGGDVESLTGHRRIELEHAMRIDEVIRAARGTRIK